MVLSKICKRNNFQLIVFFFAIFFFSIIQIKQCTAQKEAYITDGRNIYLVNLETCETNFFGDFEPAFPFLDLAYCPTSEKLYAITEQEFLYDVELETTEAKVVFNGLPDGNAVTCDENDMLYGAYARHIFSIDTKTGNYKTLIRGGSGNDYAYRSAGDLTFYKGDLILATEYNGLVRFDISNFENIKGIIAIDSIDFIYGLSSVFSSCIEDLYLFASKNIYLKKEDERPKLICENVIENPILGSASKTEIYKEPIVRFGSDKLLCDGEEIILDVKNFLAMYTWQDGSKKSSYKVRSTGTYSVNVQVADCIKKDTISIQYKDLPIVELGQDLNLCKGDTLILDAHTKNGSYFWSDGTINSNIEIVKSGKYRVEVTVDNCSNTDDIDVSFVYCDPVLDLPNIITPNGDNKNEYFTPILYENIRRMHTEIFNRWGIKIFESDDFNINWKPEGIGNDTYYYSITIIDKAYRSFIKKGWIEVLK